jgi:pimeloyl-ACP methyl ester carboxylesterase
MTLELTFSRLSGDADAALLLVVGPSLGTAVGTLWGECATLLGDGVEVVGWDLPGHGSSRPATVPFTIAELADAVRECTTALARDRRAAYAGVSLGGTLAFDLATDPGPFAAAASIASAPRIGEPASWHERADLVRRAGTPVMVSGSSVRWFAPGFAERRPDVASALLHSLSQADSGSYAWACEALAELEPGGVVEPCLPLLVVAGEHDVVLPPEVVEVAARNHPGASYRVVAGCGHLPPAEDPAAVAALLTEILLAEKVAP